MKADTLQRIEAEIAAKDYGKARDWLHGLLSTYPNDLGLRGKLGNVYWQLQHPAMAGRYWYLEAEKTADMLAACRAFEHSCGNDPVQMLLALKFRGDIESIQDTFAGRTSWRFRSEPSRNSAAGSNSARLERIGTNMFGPMNPRPNGD